jgi:uncharacterized phage protein (TIGR01671 family)
MKDRHLFKAKRADNGKWVQGYLYGIWEKRYILWGMTNDVPNMIEVDPSTICQCTGLKDKNGNLIWESDIVKDLFSDACAQIKYGSYQSCFDSTKTEHVGFYVDWSGKYTKRYRKDLGYWINMVNAEVIGNIFDTQDLLWKDDE